MLCFIHSHQLCTARLSEALRTYIARLSDLWLRHKRHGLTLTYSMFVFCFTNFTIMELAIEQQLREIRADLEKNERRQRELESLVIAMESCGLGQPKTLIKAQVCQACVKICRSRRKNMKRRERERKFTSRQRREKEMREGQQKN